MAVESSTRNKRRLSLDINGDSKANDIHTKTWMTNDSKVLNGGTHRNSTDSSGSQENGNPSQSTRKSSRDSDFQPDFHVQNSKEGNSKPQPSAELTFFQRYFSWRYVMVLLLQSSFMVVIFFRNCLPMAMVCMVSSVSSSSWTRRSSNETMNGTDFEVAATLDKTVFVKNFSLGNDTTDKVYEFDWDSEVRGMVLSSVLYSSWLGPLLLEPMRIRLGNKKTLTLCNLCATLTILLCPLAARVSPYLLVALRIITGIVQGSNVPIIGDSLAWWAPQSEKLTMMAFTFTGMNIGGILTSFFSGYLCSIPIDHGWPFIFYTFGALGLLWGVAWHFLSSQKPEDHPFISEKEREYIVSHRVGMETDAGGKREKPPYRTILTSVPVLAFLWATSCHIWSSNLIFTYLPIYITKFLGFPVQETGILVSVISLCRMSGGFMWTVLGNKMAAHLSINSSRKICVFIGYIVASAAQMGVGFFDKNDRWAAFALLLVVMIGQSVGSSTLTALPLDMAPRYAGFLTGLFVSFGTLISISGPLMTAALTSNDTAEEWRTVWLIMASVYFSGGLVFTLFGQAALQPWAQANRASIPHIVSPFVTMGRRFSAIMEAPPLTPVTAVRSKRFDFTFAVQASAAIELSNVPKASPEAVTVQFPNVYQTHVGKESANNVNGSHNGEFKDGFENKAFEEDHSQTLSTTSESNSNHELVHEMPSQNSSIKMR